MNDSDTTDPTTRALRDALTALADTVHADPAPYPDALRTWRRRERRRRLILAALILAVFTVATAIGLWVLNDSAGHPHDLFGVAGAKTLSVTTLFT